VREVRATRGVGQTARLCYAFQKGRAVFRDTARPRLPALAGVQRARDEPALQAGAGPALPAGAHFGKKSLVLRESTPSAAELAQTRARPGAGAPPRRGKGALHR